jgi:hypothetical protein
MKRQHQKDPELPKIGQRGTTDQDLPDRPGDAPVGWSDPGDTNVRRAVYTGESPTDAMVENPQQADVVTGGDYARYDRQEKDPASTQNAPKVDESDSTT